LPRRRQAAAPYVETGGARTDRRCPSLQSKDDRDHDQTNTTMAHPSSRPGVGVAPGARRRRVAIQRRAEDPRVSLSGCSVLTVEGQTEYINFYDIERRPGAGVELWGKAVALQLDRVVDANNRHRQGLLPDATNEMKDPTASDHLHADVYFLALAIRRVLLFHDAVAAQVTDDRLTKAYNAFLSAAADAKDFRDYFEHLDEYLVGAGKNQKKGRVADRISPVLLTRWDCANVVVRFGNQSLDITEAADAAIKLADATSEVWYDHLDEVRPKHPEPPTEDGVLRMMEAQFGISILVGGDDEGYQQATGGLVDVYVREATPEEVARHEADESE
jgi:hypothetical protein